MATVTVTKTVNAPIANVWNSWDDYANIHKFHPGVQHSYLLENKQETGMGALRQCDFTDGKTFLKERITTYKKHQTMTVEIYDTNAPIKDAHANFEFRSLGANQTQVTMTMIFTPKMGLLGKLILPLMKMQFSKGLMGLLEGNANYVEKQLAPAAA